jgi:hypothetical protein
MLWWSATQCPFRNAHSNTHIISAGGHTGAQVVKQLEPKDIELGNELQKRKKGEGEEEEEGGGRRSLWRLSIG